MIFEWPEEGGSPPLTPRPCLRQGDDPPGHIGLRHGHLALDQRWGTVKTGDCGSANDLRSTSRLALRLERLQPPRLAQHRWQ